ncbi:hypothetical protein IQ268_04655 [Oculatella sp. LEGE 06141]|uniref:hypothetical protein n=1 Tax=Oculatella sp. LEGE 06141 TaxID=1828648 RepID=UPI00187DEB3E|nr:hypothetical protein [Oculatella sp. LEGE 06141]MBE9177873.1 hypothetical protein [Oculatella sp. LEGE 06141]
MAEPTFHVPESVTFEQAIALTDSLLAQIEQGACSDAEIEQAIAALVSSQNGARGFFVTYLSGERSLADHPSPAVIRALQSAPETVAELLVKNLAMSSAMAITHRRNQNAEMAQGSEQVRSRTFNLIQLTQLPLVAEKASKLLESAVTGVGSYQAFLDRWGYDAEQRLVIQQAMKRAIAQPDVDSAAIDLADSDLTAIE